MPVSIPFSRTLLLCCSHSQAQHTIVGLDLTQYPGETDIRPDPAAQGGSLEERERALLGEDAELFASTQPGAATVEDGDGDLLGGDDGDFISAPAADSAVGAGNDDLNEFESSFPAIDTQNDVCTPPSNFTLCLLLSSLHHHD